MLTRGPLRAFQSRDFTFYWVAALLAILSHFMLFILRGWLALELTDSPFMVAAVAASGEIPSLFFSIPGGILADRVSRKAILIIAEIVNAVALIALAALIFSDEIAIWQVVALSVVAGTAFAIAMPARAAIVPNIVERSYIANGVALSSMMFSGGMLIGPAVAGGLLEAFGMAISFAIAALTSVASIFVLLPVQTHQTIRGGAATLRTAWQDTIDGLVYVRRQPIIFGLLAVMLIVVVFGSPWEAMLPVFARDVLDAGEIGLGLLGAAAGLGAIAASLVVAAVNGPAAMRNYTVLGSVGLGGFIAAFALSDTFVTSLIFATVAGFMFQLVLTVNNAVIQIVADDEIRGRVAAVRSMMWGAAPIGVFLLGAMAESFGAPTGTAVTGFATIVLSVVVIMIFPGLRQRHIAEVQVEIQEEVATIDGSV